MSTQIPLHRRLQTDYNEALIEVAQTEERLRLLRAQAQYIKSLLDSAEAEERERKGGSPMGEFTGMAIAEVAVEILRREGKAMSAMEISQRAMEGGFESENIERARSHFSAVISRDIRGANPRFRQIGRGAIGLVDWETPEVDIPDQRLPVKANAQPSTKSSVLPQPFGEEESYKEDDIPF